MEFNWYSTYTTVGIIRTWYWTIGFRKRLVNTLSIPMMLASEKGPRYMEMVVKNSMTLR